MESFELEEIEDVRIIIKAKGLNWALIPNSPSHNEAKTLRIALGVLALEKHSIVSPALEKLKQHLTNKIKDNEHSSNKEPGDRAANP